MSRYRKSYLHSKSHLIRFGEHDVDDMRTDVKAHSQIAGIQLFVIAYGQGG